MSAIEYYDHTTFPSQGAAGSSAAMRAELETIEAGFGKLPDLAGNGNKVVLINPGATGMTAAATTGTGDFVRGISPTLVTPTIGQANFTSVGAYAVTFTFTGITGVTFPTTGTLATLAGAETLTNKTLTSPVINAPTGITAANIANTPAGGVTESTVQGAIDGLETRKANIAAIQAQTHTAFTTAGTSTAYTLTPSPAITAYAAGQSFFVTFNAASGAAPTLAISGLATPPNLVKQNADGTYSNIAANDIPINHRSRVTLLSATQALVRIPAVTAAMLSGAQTGTAPIYGCRAWVNFNGTGAIAIRGSGNVSSITDNGVGDYTVNFTTEMPDSNYAVFIASTGQNLSNLDAQAAIYGTTATGAATKTTTAIRVHYGQITAFSAIDAAEMNVVIFR